MKKIIFVRIAPYSYKLPGKTLYESLDAIGLQRANPHIFQPSQVTKRKASLILKKYKPDVVFCSTLARSRETALLFSENPIAMAQLNEIKFSMNDFSNPQELEEDKLEAKKINKIRYNFSRALLNNKLQERQKDILERIAEIRAILDNLDSHKTILCVSHGFIMKLFENSFLCDYQKSDFSILVLLHDWIKPTYGFLKYFHVRQLSMF